MTPPGTNPSQPQFTAVEKTAMYRSTWELDVYVRQHVADLAGERRACSPIAPRADRLPGPITQLRHRLGVGLIRVGHALAGVDAGRGLPTSPPRPAAWGTGS